MIAKIIIKLFFYVLKKDQAYRLAWHDNLAMMAYDAGAKHRRSNEYAGIFMYNLIGINTFEEHMNRTTITVNSDGI